MAARDYYDILGVSRDADARAIKRAFLKLARKVHPDVSDDPESEEKFKEINEAYSVLSDETKRANYDTYGDPNGPSGFGGFGSDGFGTNISDIFETFFGGMGGMGGRGGSRPVRTQGRDLRFTLNITLEEAAAGVTKKISYKRQATCPTCEGKGSTSGDVITCGHCHGTGHISYRHQTMLGMVEQTQVCPECQGMGTVVKDPCPDCHGSGQREHSEQVDLTIPAGIEDGQQMLLRGMGEAGLRGAEAGNLMVVIRIIEHDRFVRQIDDLYVELEIDALTACVGTSVQIPGIMQDEVVDIDIHPGVQMGEDIRVEQKGMPRQRGLGRGSLVAVVRIVVPMLSEDEMHDLKTWMEEHGKMLVDSDDLNGAPTSADPQSAPAAKETNAHKTAQARRRPKGRTHKPTADERRGFDPFHKKETR